MRARLILRAFGVRGILRRAAYLARVRSGYLRTRVPPAERFSGAPVTRWTHRFDVASIRRGYEGLDPGIRDLVRTEAERVLAGEIQLYGGPWKAVGWPPAWHVNPSTGYEYPRVHWSQISDDQPDRGDIKDVWELSRFSFGVLLSRAYAATGDPRYSEAWWLALEDWAANNPPNTGVNWRCGQETSLRAMAICFALSVFGDAPVTTPDRSRLAAQILDALADRVHTTLGYALSQRNNHAVSELAFLLSVRARGEARSCRLLNEVLADQFAADGSYIQQSFTYHRLAIQALQWLLVARPDLPEPLAKQTRSVLARSRSFIARCMDPVSGSVPNYGANDGALLFPVTSSPRGDFRPLLATLGLSERGPEEAALWLCTEGLPDVDLAAMPSTYQTLRGDRSLAMTRIGADRPRPGHGDQQALDLWIDGHNIVIDPGTYRYTAPAPWRNALTGPEVHSTVTTSHRPMQVGRFLHEPMPSAQVMSRGSADDIEWIVSRRREGGGELWRAIVRRGNAFAVVDLALAVDATVRWNLGDAAAVAEVSLPPHAFELTSRDDDPPSGWASPWYSVRHPMRVALVPLPAGGQAIARFTGRDELPLEDGELRSLLAGRLPGWEPTEPGAAPARRDDTATD